MSGKNKNKWLRVILQGTKKYGYVLVNNKNKPVLFNSNTGYFRVYDRPNTQSHYYYTYLVPKNKPSNNAVNAVNYNNPVQLEEVQITAKEPTEFVGILRTPDDHWAALARDRAVDAKVNPWNDLLQNFFANLMTGGMYSSVDLGTTNLAKGNYVEGAVQMATPVMFGPAESTVANLTRLGVGAYDLLNKNGVRKTLRLANNKDWTGAAKSAAGDALNLGMTLGGGYNLGKYNIPSFVLLAARNGNNTARSYLISKELNLNIRNFDGTVGEELPNKNLYVDTSKATEPTRYLFDSPTYLMYTGPQHDISEVINVDGSVNLRNLLNILNEALKNIPGGTIARHRLENKKWHPTDWNTLLHTRDVYKRALLYNYPKEALFPTLMHDAGKLWAGDGHGPYGASIIQLIFPKASKEQILAIYGHMEANPGASLTRFVKGVDIKEPNQFRYTSKTVEPTDNTSLKFFERPNKLSFRERIGLSKGSYNDLDKYLKDALSDLELFYTSGLYRDKFAYNPNTDKFEYTNILSDGKTSGLKKIVDTGNYTATEDFIRSGNGLLAYYFKLHNGGIYLVPDGLTFGEMSARPLTTYGKLIILTSPKVDMLDMHPDLVKEASKLPDRIDKLSMKRFWDSVQQTTRPGTYLSGDNGVPPLGYLLISSYKGKNLSLAIKNLLSNNYDVDNINMRSGLSPDSYYSIIKLGLRPEHSLRFSRNGFTKLNSSAVDNKDLYQMWKSATTPEAKLLFISTWNSRIYPNSSFINNKGLIEFLHPFVYYKKFGGKLIVKGK